MFKVEIKNLSISANLGITELERKKKQLLKVTLSFDYKVKDSLNLNNTLALCRGGLFDQDTKAFFAIDTA